MTLLAKCSNCAEPFERLFKFCPNCGLSVMGSGFTDTAGPAEYNMMLSDRRAIAVRDYLKALGVTAEMTTIPRGQEDLRVATPDGVKERENRRVEVHIN